MRSKERSDDNVKVEEEIEEDEEYEAVREGGFCYEEGKTIVI